ncbi:MAG: CBS domain-containing protein, partial [Verrucomicrobiota bacterium]
AGKSVSRVSHVMKSPVRTISAEEPIEKAAQTMTRFHIGGLPVVNKGELLGIVTESDIFRALTSVLAGSGNSARITFDITEDLDVVKYLVEKAFIMKLDLRSFLTFEDGLRKMAVARVRGGRAGEFVEELWDSGHSVINVIWLD